MKGGLRQYIKGHAGGTKKCNFYVKLFLYDSTLKEHMKTHEMQKSQWHHCPVNNCNLKFKRKSGLKCHTEVHEALDSGKPYSCDMCDCQ